MKNIFLKVAAFIYFSIAILHGYIIFAGAPAYRYFGAGEQMATQAEQGSWIPAATTSFIVLVFIIWGVYALSAARVIKPVFLTRTALTVILGILFLRGGLPFLAAIFMPLDSFTVISSFIVLSIGIIHAVGMHQIWDSLEPDSLNVRNLHHRKLENDPRNAQLINQLASGDDVLWAHERWMPMKFDRPLQVGARGGHGSIRYDIESYTIGQGIRFRFTAPRGFDGWHGFTLEPNGLIRHELICKVSGRAIWLWLLIRPIHDAVIEDCFDKAQAFASAQTLKPRTWSLWVQFLHRISPRED